MADFYLLTVRVICEGEETRGEEVEMRSEVVVRGFI